MEFVGAYCYPVSSILTGGIYSFEITSLIKTDSNGNDGTSTNTAMYLNCIGIISGHIFNTENGFPVPKAKVYIRDAKGHVYSGMADNYGYFRSSLIFCPSNSYEIICDTFGYMPESLNVSTDVEGNADLNISIPQEFEVNPETCATHGGIWQGGYCNFAI